MSKKTLKQAQRAARRAEKKARERAKRQEQASRTPSAKRRALASRIQKILDYIQGNPMKNFSATLSADLQAVLSIISQHGQGFYPLPGDYNGFSIAPGFQKHPMETLINFVHINRIPAGLSPSDMEKLRQYVDKMEQHKWASPENYDKFLQSAHAKAFQNFMRNRGIKLTPSATGLIIGNLETYLNSSRIWRIVSAQVPDSEQAAALMAGLVRAVGAVNNISPRLTTEGRDAFLDLLTMLENGDDVQTIIALLDDIVADAAGIYLK